MIKVLKFALLMALLVTTALARSPYEFHHGYGGFSIDPKVELADQIQITYRLDEYTLWGETLIWKGDGYGLSVSLCSVIKRNSQITASDKTAVLSKWKAAFAKQASERKLTLTEKPFIFNGFKGIEILATGDPYVLTRAFFIGTRLNVVSLSSENLAALMGSISIPNSFRLLTETERTIAMLEQYSPSLLPQERPDRIPPPDKLELGLQGNVKRIQDTFQKTAALPKRFSQQIDFDVDGFIVRETSFLDGFPDVITAWGWVDGKRANTQSGVTYPDREGPQLSRQIVLSGGPLSLPNLLPSKRVSRQFGNRIDTKFDDRDIVIEKRRYAGSAQLVFIETHKRVGNVREIKVTDSVGGFISWVREKLDERGNILESETLIENGSAYKSEVFEYEFDSNKNWIVKKVFGKATGKAIKKPFGIYHRTITYHEASNRNIGMVTRTLFK